MEPIDHIHILAGRILVFLRNRLTESHIPASINVAWLIHQDSVQYYDLILFRNLIFTRLLIAPKILRLTEGFQKAFVFVCPTSPD